MFKGFVNKRPFACVKSLFKVETKEKSTFLLVVYLMMLSNVPMLSLIHLVLMKPV